MPANFNSIAYIYNGLSRIVFGNTIKKSQQEMLSFIPANSSILIVGGGTGWILEEICKIHLDGLHITYVDNSSKMISLSKEQNIAKNQIIFITAPIETLELEKKYDVVMTPFLLDMFQQANCDKIVQLLHNCLRANGIWIYSDFQISSKSKLSQKILLRLMYSFFKVSCKIETTQLPKTETYFLLYFILAEKTYLNDFIISKALKKIYY